MPQRRRVRRANARALRTLGGSGHTSSSGSTRRYLSYQPPMVRRSRFRNSIIALTFSHVAPNAPCTAYAARGWAGARPAPSRVLSLASRAPKLRGSTRSAAITKAISGSARSSCQDRNSSHGRWSRMGVLLHTCRLGRSLVRNDAAARCEAHAGPDATRQLARVSGGRFLAKVNAHAPTVSSTVGVISLQPGGAVLLQALEGGLHPLDGLGERRPLTNTPGSG